MSQTVTLSFSSSSGTAPEMSPGTGTISSSPAFPGANETFIYGTGTSFTTQLQEGGWIVVSNVLYQVYKIIDDETAVLNEAPSAAFSSDNFYYVSSRFVKSVQVNCMVDGVKVNNSTVAMIAGTNSLFENKNPMTNLKPILIDASTGECTADIVYQ